MIKTVSLETAQKLREAGYPQKDSYFHWSNAGKESELIHAPDGFDDARINDHFRPEDVLANKEKHFYVYYSAPTSDEILDELPWQVESGIDRGRLVVEKSFHTQKWKVTYVDMTTGGRFAQSNEDESIAESAAKMWLYLKAQGLLKGTV